MSNSTRKILKSLKNVSFKQEDFIMIGEFEIPIVSRSIGESNKIMTSLLSSIKTKVPKKTRYANAEEVELLKKKDPQMKGIPMITVYDETNDEYQKKSLELATAQRILESVGQYIDMDYKTETGSIWSDWEIQMNDWTGVGIYLLNNFTEKELEEMEIAIKAKFGDRIHAILLKLQEMSGKSVIEILRSINRISEIDKLEEELKGKAMALKDMEEEIYNVLEVISQGELNEDGDLEVPEIQNIDIDLDDIDSDEELEAEETIEVKEIIEE